MTGTFVKYQFPAGPVIHFPIARVNLHYQGIRSRQIDALVDSGAGVNLIPESSIKFLFGDDISSQIRGGPNLTLSGLGGKRVRASRLELDLELQSTSIPRNATWWRNSVVYITPDPIPIAHMLIGQWSGLQERRFVHLNRSQNRYWILED